MNVKEPKRGHFSITCDHCGKPITRTSEDFGMDCEDECGRKAFEAETGVTPAQAKKDLMSTLMNIFNE